MRLDKIVTITIVVFLMFSLFTSAFAHTLDGSDKIEEETGEENRVSKSIETSSTNKLTIEVNNSDRGTTVPVPGTYDFPEGREVTITAKSYVGYTFDQWTGDYNGTEKEITIEMDGDKQFTANFKERGMRNLEIYVETESSWIPDYAGGITNPIPTMDVDYNWMPNITSHSYPYGEKITVEAIPFPSWEFVEWDGDVPAGQQDEKNITITMEEDKNITAIFEFDGIDWEIPNWDIHQLDIHTEVGGMTFPSSLLSPHYYLDTGEEVKEDVKAQSFLGWEFVNWTGDMPAGKEKESELTITIDSDKSLTANFESPEPVADLGQDRTVDEEEIVTLVNNQEAGLYQYEWNFGDGNKIPFGPPVITHNYSELGIYNVELTVRDILGREDTDEITVTVEESEGTDVLLLDWLTDQGVKGAGEIEGIMPDLLPPWYNFEYKTPPLLSDEVEREFWDEINSKNEFNIITRPPVYREPTIGGNSYDIEDYLEIFDPEIIILSDNFLNAEGRWNLNKNQRLALVDHLEEGNSLMATGGSLNDLRLKTPETSTQIGQWNHTNRLYLDEADSIDGVLENYRSSLTATMGLGLFPLYQEAREWVGMALEEMYHNTPEPISKAALFAASTVAYSVPLLPANVPFDSDFSTMETDSNITDGLGDEFELNLLNRYTKNETSSIGNITGETDLTSTGWQLQYPFLMAHNIINRTSEGDFLMDDVQDSLMENLSIGAESMNQLFDHPFTQYDFGNQSLPTESPLTSEDLRNITENITDSLLQFLKDMYKARTDVPSQIELDINFTVGEQEINETIAIPIPVPLQKLFRPAEIATTSKDGRAGVLKYEIDGQRYEFDSEISWDPPSPSDFSEFDQIRDNFPKFDPVNEIPISYRTAYFTFKPSLGKENSSTMVENTLRWLGETPEPQDYELIGSMGVPADLVAQTRENFSEQADKSVENKSMLLQKNEKKTMDISIEEEGSLQVYWTGAKEITLTLNHDDKEISVEPQRYEHDDYRSASFKIEESGDWTLEAEVNADGLKTPMMTQKISTTAEETPNFEVEITDYDDQVIRGEEVKVNYTVTNTGNAEGTQEIVFTVDGNQVDMVEMTIAAGETEQGEFTWEPGEAGDYELEVASDDDSQRITTTVNSYPDNEPFFVVEITGHNIDGDEVRVEYNVTNRGGTVGTQDIEFCINGEIKKVEENVELQPDESFTGDFSWEVEEAGDYDCEVRCEDKGTEDSVTISIEEGDLPEDEEGLFSNYWWLIPLIVIVAVIAIGITIAGKKKKPPDQQPSQEGQPPPPPQEESSSKQQQPPSEPQEPPENPPPPPPKEK